MRRVVITALSMLAMLASTQAGRAQTAKAADLTGQWHFVLETGGGDRESEADFHVEGDNVTGKYGKAEVAGTFKNGKMDLAFPITTEEAGSGTLKLTGTVDGDALTGNWEFTEYNGTFKATRKPMDAAKPSGGI